MGADTLKDFNKFHDNDLIHYNIFFVAHTELYNWLKAKKPLEPPSPQLISRRRGRCANSGFRLFGDLEN